MAAVAAIGQKTRDDWLHFRKINLKLLMVTPLAQFAATLRAAWQFGNLRLTHFLQARFGSLYKTAFPSFAPRPLGMLYPVPARKRYRLPLPSSFQFFHLSLQKFHLPSHFLQLLNQRQSFCQLLLQFRNAFVFRVRKGVLVPALAHAQQCTISTASLTRVLQPVFFTSFDPSQNYAF